MNFKRQLQLSEDGSHTLYVPELDEHYHSIHGAIQESAHVFIQNGLNQCNIGDLTIFEVGFGTGLNAFLSLINRNSKNINYIGIEKYPLTEVEYKKLNYTAFHGEYNTFLQMHQCEWNIPTEIIAGFLLTKIKSDLQTARFEDLPFFNLVYFDAFAPNKQPEMWDEAIFAKIAEHTAQGGLLVTYCAQGEVRRKLTRCGFKMYRIPGPPGKKEMLFGEKL